MPEKAVIVTGAAGGVGKDVIAALAMRGFYVYAGAIDDWELSEIEAIKQSRGLADIHPVMLDLRQHKDIDALATEIEREHLELAGLVLNGAAAPMGVPFEYTSVELMRNVVETNLLGNYAAIQRCLPLLKRHAGRVAIVSSATTLAPPPMVIPYVTTKSALSTLAHSLRRELRNTPVKFSLLIPGVIKETYMSQSLREGTKRRLAEIRNCLPDDISPLTYEVGGNTALMQPEGGADPFYEGMYQGQFDTISTGLTTGFDPALVTRDVLRCLESKRPKPVYYQGKFSYLFAILGRFLPHRWMDWVTVKIGYR